MNRISTKAVFVVAGCALTLTLMIGGARAQNPTDRAAMLERSPKKASEVYKNLQLLQDIPADQVHTTMRFIAGALGVGCNYCHEGGGAAPAWEKDTKPTKAIARQMIRMVFDINKNLFDERLHVTCVTCHRGSTEVDNMSVVVDRTDPLEESAPASRRETDRSLPTADQVFDNFLAALGGADAIQKITSRVQKGTVTAERPDRPTSRLPVEIFTKAPDKRSFETHQRNVLTRTFVNGLAGFLIVGDREPEDLSLGEIDVAKIADTLYLARRGKQVLQELKVLREQKIGDRDVYAVFGRTEDLQRIWFYFDKESGMLLRILHYHPTGMGRIPAQIDFVDYHTVDGVKVPFRWVISQARGRRYTYDIDQVEQNVPIEDSKFEVPGESAALR